MAAVVIGGAVYFVTNKPKGGELPSNTTPDILVSDGDEPEDTDPYSIPCDELLEVNEPEVTKDGNKRTYTNEQFRMTFDFPCSWAIMWMGNKDPFTNDGTWVQLAISLQGPVMIEILKDQDSSAYKAWTDRGTYPGATFASEVINGHQYLKIEREGDTIYVTQHNKAAYKISGSKSSNTGKSENLALLLETLRFR